MKKIPTLFKKDPNDLGRVINEVHPDSAWVFEDHNVMATRKFDGTACAIIEGQLYKRYDVKKGKSVPKGAIPCQGADEITGHWPHWIKCEREDPSNKYHFDAFDNMGSKYDGTYELCGPKIQGNPENFGNHLLIRHGEDELTDCVGWSFEELKEYLTKKNIEGIVFHGDNNKMCKIRKSDFGIDR
jgi:hypothetical protein